MATSIQPQLRLPDTFKYSYQKLDNYPRNLIHQTSYPAALKSYFERLEAASPTLFEQDEQDVQVHFRELVGQTWGKLKVHSDEELKSKLGDLSSIDPERIATRRDPNCRFVFLWAGDSRSALKITRKMFLRILTYHQVMPSYLDFISVFGSQSEPRDLRFSGFREQIVLNKGVRAPEIRSLGRSGRQYQLCYNLKGVYCKMSASRLSIKTVEREWSIRQAAFYHCFDVEEGTSIWITAKGDLELKDRIEDMTGANGRPEEKDFETPRRAFRSNLAVHLLQCHWSTEEWRYYIQGLEAEVEDETHLAVHGPRGLREAQYNYSPRDLQSIQYVEDKTNEAIMVLEANSDVLTSIRKFYERLIENSEFELSTACSEDVTAFAMQVDDMIYDSRMQIARAKVLARITDDRKTLVLQHLQSQATQKMEVLTVSMHEIGAQSQREAIAMRIITVMTLIYLPATFVSTFFSTDIVKYQGGSSFSGIAMQRWLEVTLPLTLMTLGIAWLFYRHEEKSRKRKIETTVRPFLVSESKASFDV